jgi:hypothetical protein
MGFFIPPSEEALQRGNLFVIPQIHGLSFLRTFTNVRDVLLIVLSIIILYVVINAESVILFDVLCGC